MTAAAAILDFRICEILLACGVWRAQLLSLCQILSKLVVLSWRYFNFSRWPQTPSWIFEVAKFYWLTRSRVSRRIRVSNSVKIGQFVANILRFFDFSKWRPPPSWICLGHIWTTQRKYFGYLSLC